MWITALAASTLSLAPTPDLVKPGEEAAFQAQLGQVIRGVALARGGGSCPADTKLDFGGAHRIGTAGALLKATASDPVAPEAFVYKQQYRVSGCPGQARQDNVLMVRQKAGGWVMLPFVPGDTAVTPQLLHDVIGVAVPLATTGGPPPGQACPNGSKAYVLTDTVLLTPPPTAGAGPVTWSERWVQSACGQDRSVRISFTAIAGGGTTFEVRPDWAAPETPR